MGSGSYSSKSRTSRATSMGYDTKPREEIFTERQVNNAMNPNGIKVRESRDSKEHPNSLAIILALDVTGSMGSIPHYLVKEGLPNIMAGIIQRGVADPQMLFLGFGDHTCDKAPLQVGQFESSDELLDKWLTTIYLEGGGGGNPGESYMLPWYFAAYHTSIDCYEKHKQKGFLFTVGDEPVLKDVPASFLKKLMGDGQYENFRSEVLLDKAREKYIVKHLHLREGANGNRQEVIDGWKQIMGGDLIIVGRKEDIATIITDTVVSLMSPMSLANKMDDKKVHEGIIL